MSNEMIAAIAAIVVAVISGIASVTGVVITARSSNNKIQHQLEIAQAVQNTKLDALAAEVRTHNEFGRRIPVMEEQIKTVFVRLDELKQEVKHES